MFRMQRINPRKSFVYAPALSCSCFLSSGISVAKDSNEAEDTLSVSILSSGILSSLSSAFKSVGEASPVSSEATILLLFRRSRDFWDLVSGLELLLLALPLLLLLLLLNSPLVNSPLLLSELCNKLDRI